MNEINFAKKVANLGGCAYIVGGWNRDVLLGVEPKDKDYCVTGFNQETFLQAFQNAKQVIGKDGEQTVDVFLLDIDSETQEVALARRERKNGTGYHGFEFEADKTVTIEEDLVRRDLTINAIAFDVLEGNYIYPEGAMDDIESGVLRAVSDAFYEDPLRVYRVAVRHAITGFTVEDRTKEMMKQAASELTSVPKERVMQELKKALVSNQPDLFFRLLAELDILSVHFQEISDLMNVPQPVKFHPEGDAFEHTMLVLKAMRDMTEEQSLLFAALVHDLGKGITPIELLPSHHGHEEAGVPLVKSISKRLGVPNKWKKAAIFATAKHGRFHIIHKMKDVKVVDLLTEAERTPLGAKGLVMVALADTRGKDDPEAVHPNAGFALQAIQQIKQVKGKQELEGRKAWDDKRKRQAEIIRNIRIEMAAI